MRRQAYCWLALLSALLLSACKNTELQVLSVVEQNNTGYIVTDGTTAYSYNGEFEILGNQYLSMRPIKPLSSFSSDYSLKHIELSSYSGTLQDAIGYYNFLLSIDYTVTSLTYNANCFDVLLTSNTDEIRVLYLGSDVVRIFYKNFEDSSALPPYIYRKGESTNA